MASRFKLRDDVPALAFREEPSPTATIKAQLTFHDVLIKQAEAAGGTWWKVRREGAPEGDSGFVMAEFLQPAGEPPAPSNEIDKVELAHLLVLNARRFATNAVLLAAVAWCESRFRNVVNEASDATGPFQFIPDTWENLVTLYGDEHGITPDGITDLSQQCRMAGLSFATYAQQVKNKLNRPGQAVELYFCHFFGYPAACHVLAEDRQKPIDEPLRGYYTNTPRGAGFVDIILQQNPQLKEGGQVLTTAAVLQQLAEKLSGGLAEGAALFGQPGAPTPGPTPAPANPAAVVTTDFEGFVDALGLRHFSAEELRVGTANPGNAMPPDNLWGNIVATIIILDALREELNRPITISSGYRSPTYNGTLEGAAPLSQHQAFRALDFSVAGVDAPNIADKLRGWRGRQFRAPAQLTTHPLTVAAGEIPMEPLAVGGGLFTFAGGVGKYQRFVHLDTRGIDVNWDRHT